MTVAFSNTQVADILEVAAEHVREGWTQHELFSEMDDNVYCCSSGAIWLAAGLSIAEVVSPHVVGTKNFELWYHTYRRLSDHVGDDAPRWNDAVGQTQDRVVDTMLQLAKELRNVETP